MERAEIEHMIRSAERQTSVLLSPAARSLLLKTAQENRDRLGSDLRSGRMTRSKMRGAIVRLLSTVGQLERPESRRVRRPVGRKKAAGAVRKLLPRTGDYLIAPRPSGTEIFPEHRASIKSVAGVQLLCQFYPFCNPSKSKTTKVRS